MGRDCLSWCCHETNMTSHKALEEQTMMPHCRVCFLQSSEDHLCLTRYVCQRVSCERRFLQSSSWVMGRSKGPHARRVAKEGREASNGTAYSFQQVLCSLPLLPPPDLSLIAFLIQTHWTSAPLDLFLWWRRQCNRLIMSHCSGKEPLIGPWPGLKRVTETILTYLTLSVGKKVYQIESLGKIEQTGGKSSALGNICMKHRLK